MTTMYDSVDPSQIPADAAIVAGYVDGLYAWGPQDWARFPNAQQVRIACFPGTNAGDVLDVEVGCSTPEEAPGWAKARRAEGVDPTIYCSVSVVPEVVAAFSEAGEPQPHYWVADWTGTPHLYPGSVATQYANPPSSGGHFDVSLTNGVWPGKGTSPAPAPAPKPEGVQFMPVNLPVLQVGVPTSGYVKNLQVLLNTHEAWLAEDGVYGPQTAQAVKNFQTVLKLTVDGVTGPATWNALLLVAT